MSKNRITDSSKEDHSLLVELLLPVAFFLVVAGLFIWNLSSVDKTAETKALDAASQAVTRAAVQCYAIEGRYPRSIDYLAENYGLSIDEEKYVVHYDYYAENMIPDIWVFPIGQVDAEVLDGEVLDGGLLDGEGLDGELLGGEVLSGEGWE
jgi:hypothetical protein